MFFLLLSDPYYVEQGDDGCEQCKHVSFINKFIFKFKRQQALTFQGNSCCFRLCTTAYEYNGHFFQVELTFGGHDLISREGGGEVGVFVADKLFISTRLGGAL